MATQVNGFIPDFLDISVSVNNIPILKGAFQALEYSFSKDDGIVNGNQEAVVGFTSGYVNCTGSFTMLQQDFNTLTRNIIQNDPLTGGSIGTSTFNLVVTFIVGNGPVQADTLIGCKVISQRQAHAKGNTEAIVEVDMVMANLLINGVAATSNSFSENFPF